MRRLALIWFFTLLSVGLAGWVLLASYPEIVPRLFRNTYGLTAKQLASEKVHKYLASGEPTTGQKPATPAGAIASAEIREEVGLRGQFGDSFAPLAALFSAMALMIGFIGLILQDFFARAARLSQARDHVLGLIANYQAMVARIHVPVRAEPDVKNGEKVGKIVESWHGVDGLYHLWREEVYARAEAPNSLTHRELLERHEAIYARFEYQLDALFRTIYRVYFWVDSLDNVTLEEKWQLAAIVRANLSNIEQCWFLANCLTPRGERARRLFERYATFDNLGLNHPALRAIGDRYLAQAAFSSDEARKQFRLPR